MSRPSDGAARRYSDIQHKVVMNDVQKLPPPVPGSTAVAATDADAAPPVSTPCRGKMRPGVPSSLSNDNHEFRHDVDAMRRRSINLPLILPLRL